MLKRSLFVRKVSGSLFVFAVSILLCSCSGEGTKPPVPENGSDSILISDPEEIQIGIKNVDPNNPNVTGNEYLERYPNGVIKMKGNVLAGKREGQWFSFYPNGNPWSQSVYIQGMLNGPTVTFHETGKKNYQGEYTDGRRSGKWTFWDENGNILEEKDYSNSKR